MTSREHLFAPAVIPGATCIRRTVDAAAGASYRPRRSTWKTNA